MGILLVVVLVVVLGMLLAGVAARSTARWRGLVKELIPESRMAGRGLTWSISGQHLAIETPLAPAGMGYQAAARALARGPLLAVLDELKASASETLLSARIGLARIGAATLNARLRTFVALADALEAMPLAEAMARAFVELPPETHSAERLAAFQALLRWHPRAHDVLGVCQSLVRDGDDATIVALAKAHLTQVSQHLRGRAAS